MVTDPPTNILHRLRSAEGHLYSVTRMIENGEPYDQVLHQLFAVQAALSAAGCLLVKEQVKSSLEIIQYSNSSKDRLQAFDCILSLYILMKRCYFGDEEVVVCSPSDLVSYSEIEPFVEIR